MKKEQTKDYKIFNWARILVTFLVFIALCAVSVWLKNTIDLSKIPWLQYEFDIDNMTTVMSGVCQVQAAIVGIVLTVLSISTSVNRNEMFGLKIKEIISLNRSHFKFTLLEMIILQICLIGISVLMLILSAFTLLLVAFIFSSILVIWICVTDLPIALRGEDEAIKIIANALASEKDTSQSNNVNIKIFNEYLEIAIGKMILLYGFVETYNKINSIYAVDGLTDKLISLLDNEIYAIKEDSSKKDVLKILSILKEFVHDSNGLIVNIKQKERLIHYIVAELYFSEKYNFISKEEIYMDIDYILRSYMRKISDQDDVVSDIAYHVITRIFRASIENEYYIMVEIIRDQFPTINILLHDERYKKYSILFSRLTLYLVYISRYEDTVAEHTKEKILSFLSSTSSSRIENHTKSWEKMFIKYLKGFNLSINDFVDNYDIMNWEYMIPNSVKDVILTKTFAYDWWIKCWIISKKDPSVKIDTDSLNVENKNFIINALASYCEYKTQRYNMSKSLAVMQDIFRTGELEDIETERYLFDLYNELNKDRVRLSYPKQANNFDSYIGKVTNEINQRLKVSPLYDSKLNLPKKITKSNYISPWFNEAKFELDSDLLYSYIVQHMQWFIDREPKQIFNLDSEHKLKNITTFIAYLDKINTKYYTSEISQYLGEISKEDKHKIDEIEQKSHKLDIRLNDHMYIGEDGLRYNFLIEKIMIKQLSDEQIKKELMRLEKVNDTHYYDEHTQILWEKDEYEKFYYKTRRVLIMEYRLLVVLDSSKVVIPDLWGYYKDRNIEIDD